MMALVYILDTRILAATLLLFTFSLFPFFSTGTSLSSLPVQNDCIIRVHLDTYTRNTRKRPKDNSMD